MIYVIAIVIILPIAVLSELLKMTNSSKKSRGGVMCGPGGSKRRRK